MAIMVALMILQACGRGAGPHRATLGTSVEGRAIDVITIGRGPALLLLIASIHGTETAGTPLLHEFAARCVHSPEMVSQCRVMLVPAANPDGVLARRRSNARGVDLNRNFPSASFRQGRRHGRQPLSEPEAQAIHHLIITERPNAIISIHQPLECIDFDGPAQALAEAMARRCKLPVRRLGALPGSLGSFAGVDLGIPTITLELPTEASELDPEALWLQFGPALLAAIDHVAATVDQDHFNARTGAVAE